MAPPVGTEPDIARMRTYLFYDLETTGLDPAFDQPLQFAAIRTDPALEELERYEWSIRLRRDVVPAPGAVLTHRLGPRETEGGRPEVDAVRRIHALFNRPGTVSVGYNSLGFDDEFLRFAFYRNLLAPYTHQYRNGCGRMDLLTFAAVYRLFRPEGIEWPAREGKPSLRLEDLNAANGLAPGRPHAALADVEALLALARRMKTCGGDTWGYLCRRFEKAADRSEIRRLKPAFAAEALAPRLALLVDSAFGATCGFIAPALALGPSIPYPNQRLWLRLDRPELAAAGIDDVADTTWAVRKKYGEPPLVLPPLDRYWERIEPSRRRLAADNLARLRGEGRLLAAIASYHRQYAYPEVPEVDADAALYVNGFWSDDDLRRFAAFHEAAPSERTARLEAIADPVARELAARMVGRNFPPPHPEAVDRVWRSFLGRVNPAAARAPLVDHRGRPRRTPAAAREEIAALLAAGDTPAADRDLLQSLERYLTDTFGPPRTEDEGAAHG